MVRNFNKFLAFLTVTSLILTSCAPGGNKQAPVESRQATVEQSSTVSQDDWVQSGQHYLDLAGKSTVPQSYEYQMMAADAFLNAHELEQAEHGLTQIPAQDLSARLQAFYAYLSARVDFQKNDIPQALTTLNSVTSLDLLSKSQQEQFYELKASCYESLNKPLESAQARSDLDEILLMPTKKRANQDALWRDLAKTPISTLQSAANSHDRDNFSGWVELAYLLRANQVADLRQAVHTWQNQYPNHPGQNYLGPQLEDSNPTSTQVQVNYPKHIALLLPLSGTHKKAAEAIRDGFLTRYYANTQFHLAKPRVEIYDTTTVTDIKQLYQQAVAQGAEFVIGPLMKENVYELSSLSRSQIRAPILALNQNRKIENIPPYFYQFALAPEDEAEQLAQKAIQNNYRNAVIVVPKNPWGDRIIEAFRDRFESLGGNLVGVSQVSSNEDQAKAIRDLLNVESSIQRSQKIKFSVREKVYYQPRRRQDLDVIVMAAPPEQARQIKPLFDFYFAQNIPVMATSSVYAGTPDPSKDNDMNNVMFCDMPWLLDQDDQSNSAKALINQHWPSEANLYSRLFAMGVDAFELSGQLSRMQSSPRMEYSGATGYLSLKPNQYIERRLMWARFKNGQPVVMRNS